MRKTFSEKQIRNFEKKFETDGDNCWEWKASLRNGRYGSFEYNNETFNSHRISYELYVGDIPENLYVCHKCDNPKCVNPSHLFLETQKGNMNDMVSKNRQAKLKGIDHVAAKLSEKEILEIRNSNLLIRKLAKIYNCCQRHISRIKNKKCWTHI